MCCVVLPPKLTFITACVVCYECSPFAGGSYGYARATIGKAAGYFVGVCETLVCMCVCVRCERVGVRRRCERAVTFNGLIESLRLHVFVSPPSPSPIPHPLPRTLQRLFRVHNVRCSERIFVRSCGDRFRRTTTVGTGVVDGCVWCKHCDSFERWKMVGVCCVVVFKCDAGLDRVQSRALQHSLV